MKKSHFIGKYRLFFEEDKTSRVLGELRTRLSQVLEQMSFC